VRTRKIGCSCLPFVMYFVRCFYSPPPWRALAEHVDAKSGLAGGAMQQHLPNVKLWTALVESISIIPTYINMSEMLVFN
jgi:hypothetical protein